jgi:hypothetical protein
MKTYEIKEGAICLFEFFISTKGKLGLMIHSVADDSDSEMSDSSESSE